MALCVAGLPSAASAGNFAECLSGLRVAARAAGVDDASFDKATRGLEPNPEIFAFAQAQPEFKTPIWDYLAGLVDEERVSDGRAMMQRWGQALATAEGRFGVDKATITAVWGVESDYGRSFGARPVIQSLATLSCGGTRQAYFRSEFIAAVKIVQHGDIDPAQFNGSWAGAFGHTQFMPSTFLRTAVDLDGDGRKDLINSVPDALGSTANYLRKARLGRRRRLGVRGQAPGALFGSLRAHAQGADGGLGRAGHDKDRGSPLGPAAQRRTADSAGWRPRARPFSSPAISMRSILIMRRNPMRSPSRFCPIACAEGRASSPPGRPMIPASPAPSGGRCRRCSCGAAMISTARPMA